jgi:hypothetical protein
VLYPASLFAAVASPWKLLTVDAAVHLIAGGLFAYLLARDLGRSRAASILASLSFMLGGYFISKVQFPNMTQAIAYAPAVVWQSGRLARSPSIGAAVLLGSLFGLQLLSAHAQISLMTMYLAAAYAVFTAWPRIKLGRNEFPRLAGWAAIATILACGLAAGQILPDMETWRNADHQSLSIKVADRFILHPGQQIGFIDPHAFGSPYFGNFSQLGNYWETACYLGVASCLLALVGMIAAARRRDSNGIFWIVIFILSVWLAEGRYGGLYTLAFDFAPGVRAFHDPARMLIGAAIAGPLLAALGLDCILANRALSVRYALAAAILIATTFDLANFDRQIYPLKPTAVIEAAAQARSAGPQLAFPGHRIAFPPDNRMTWLYFVDYSNYRRFDSTYLSSLFATRTSNLSMFAGVREAGGYEPVPLRYAVSRYIRAYEGIVSRDYSGADELCVDSAIRLSSGGARGARGYFGSHSMTMLRNPHATTISRACLADGRYLPVTDVGPDELYVDIPAMSDSESISLADSDMPGWRAYSPSGMVSIDRTNDGLRRIEAPAARVGERIVFRYEPDSWRIGLYLTLISLCSALGYALHAVLSTNGIESRRRPASYGSP